MTLKELLSQIKCKKTCIGKSKWSSGYAYRITLTYKGKSCRFIFNDNFHDKSSKCDFLYCLILDAQSFENSKDYFDWCHDWCYDYFSNKSRKVYEACKKQSERVHRLFNDEEIELLSTIE